MRSFDLDINKTYMEIVIIKWVDSKGITNEWEFKDELSPMLPCICVSVGFLIDDAKTYKTIVQSDGITQVLGRLTIPMEAILKIKRIA